MTLFICGDSTAAAYVPEETEMTGWGQVIGAFLPEVVVDNRSFPGRSTRTFLAEGRLDAIVPHLQPHDLLLIQFGHNDGGNKPERHTEPWTDFMSNLRIFVECARKKGAVPVLLTPICVRNWQDGMLQPSHGAYVDAVRALAADECIPLIDLYQKSHEVQSLLGEAGSRRFHLHLLPGQDMRHPDGMDDDTHTSLTGALCNASIVSERLRQMGLIPQTDHSGK